jgi:4,5-DOPA dioxygenase extradiol
VLVLGSGDVVHNLRRIDFSRPDAAFDWALRFDAAVRDVMTANPAALGTVEKHPDYALSVPTPEHFLPLAYLAGLAEAAARPAEVLIEGCSMGSISMTCYTLGAHGPSANALGPGAAALPDPRVTPGEDTNT